MSLYNIVAALAIDNSEQDGNILYPMIGHFDKQMKQALYWKMAYVYFSVSSRINPRRNHILFTNDDSNASLDGFDFKRELQQLGVDIRILPFSKYYISGDRYGKFKNTLYKIEVYDQLQYLKNCSVLTDIDCLWASQWENLDQLLDRYDLLVLDRSSHQAPEKRNRIVSEMGSVFRQIDPEYPVQNPHWYGGGFIGGKPESFRILGEKSKQLFDLLVAQANDHIVYTLPYNGESMLDGDENIQSYVCNASSLKLYDINDYVKIVFRSRRFNNATPEVYRYPVWHLASEKLRGLSLLFQEVKSSRSVFWTMSKDEIKYFLGKYAGIEIKPARLKVRELADRIGIILSALGRPKRLLNHFKYYVLLLLGLR